MAEPARKRRVTFAQYLAQEKESEVKHEFVNGEIFAMAGGTLEHAQIATNVARVLGNELQDRPCRVLNSDARVRVEPTGLATYPDVTVICGKLERDPEDENGIVNPVVLVEVLSPGTEAYDRGEKFAHYSAVRTLREYVLISSERKRVEVFRRNDDASWTYYDTRDTGTASLASIGCKLPLDEVYRNVFEEAAS